MRGPLLPPPGLPPLLGSAFDKAAQLLETRCRAIVDKADGHAAAVRTVDWTRLEQDLDLGLEAGRLSVRVRFMLPALLARLGPRTSADDTLQSKIDHAAMLAVRGRVWPSQAWAILTWARDDTAQRERIARERLAWPAALQAAQPLLLSLDLSRPAADALTARVVAERLPLSALAQLDYLPPGSPLHSAVWARLVSPRNRSWLAGQELPELGNWLELGRGGRLAASAVSVVLSEHTHKVSDLPDLTPGSRLDLLLKTCVRAFRPTDHGLDLRGADPAVAELIRRWQALRDLEALLARWGGSADRKDFWRAHRGQLVDARWFPRCGYLGMRFGDLWCLEHESGLRRVTAVNTKFATPFLEIVGSAATAKQAEAALERQCKRHPGHACSRTFELQAKKEFGRWIGQGHL